MNVREVSFNNLEQLGGVQVQYEEEQTQAGPLWYAKAQVKTVRSSPIKKGTLASS